jgi:hypothetical protein
MKSHFMCHKMLKVASAPCHEDIREMEVRLHMFLTLTLVSVGHEAEWVLESI